MKPIVSVFVISYNHEKFIGQTLDCIIRQELNVPFEIVIGEDGSTDNTRKVIEEYIVKYPQIEFNLLPNSGNKGMQKNVIDTLAACRGKYVAMCEGDDYWLGDDKLQSQFHFLESKSEYSAIAHNSHKLFENWNTPWLINKAKEKGEELKKLTGYHGTCSGGHAEGDMTFDHFLYERWPFHTASIFFRNFGVTSFPEVLNRTATPDKVIFVTLLKFGKIFFEDEIRAVYRVHEGGLTNKATNSVFMANYYKNKIETLNSFYDLTDPKEKSKIKHLVAQQYIQVAIYADGRERIGSLMNAIKRKPAFLFSKVRIIGSVLYRTIVKR